MSYGHILSFSRELATGYMHFMLLSLKISNLALVQKVELSFKSGLTVLTGESGSGKSVVLDALALISGVNRPRLRARSGSSSGFAEAEFLPARNLDGQFAQEELTATLQEAGLLESCLETEEPLVLARRLHASGRSRCFIQGQTVSRATLAAVGSQLLEICGQSEAHRLRSSAAQLLALDQFAGLGENRRDLEKLYKKLRSHEQDLEELSQQVAEAEIREDFLQFQLEELGQAQIADLAEQRERLIVLEAIKDKQEAHEESVNTLKLGEHAVLPQLQWLLCRLATSIDSPAQENHNAPPDKSHNAQSVIEQLHEAKEVLELVYDNSALELNQGERYEEELETIKNHLQEVDTLAAKHRITPEQLPLRKERIARDLYEAKEVHQRHNALHVKTKHLRELLLHHAETLHQARKDAALLWKKRLALELGRVGLAEALIETTLVRGQMTASGITQLEIGFSANLGHAPQPLARVASGGELSRILLCFRLATESPGALLTFDEIDAGAGGKTAEKIAQALLRAANKSQVLCVTHWAQVAALADHQLAVAKSTIEGSASTTIEPVVGDSRIEELSRMLGGAKLTARKHASELVLAPLHTS